LSLLPRRRTHWQFTRPETLEGFGTAVVRSATLQNSTACAASGGARGSGSGSHAPPPLSLPCQQLLELEPPGLVLTGGLRLGVDVIENLAHAPDVTVASCSFGRLPTRGILVTSRGAVRVLANTLHTPLGAALQVPLCAGTRD
jgi:hypothetical protein